MLRAKYHKSRIPFAEAFNRREAATPLNEGIATEDRTAMIVNTIITSIKVNPADNCLSDLAFVFNPVSNIGVVRISTFFPIFSIRA